MKPASTSSPEDTTKAKVSFKEFLQISRWVLGILLAINPTAFITGLISALFLGLRDIVNTFIFAKIIDALIKVTSSDTGKLSDLYPYLALMLGFNLLITALTFVNRYSNTILRQIGPFRIRELLYTKLNDLGIQTLEQPEINNKIYRASDSMGTMVSQGREIVDLLVIVMQTASTVVIIASFFPIFLPLAILASIPYLINDRRFRGVLYTLNFDFTEDQRRARHSADHLSYPTRLQEIYTSQAFKFLGDKYIKFNEWFSSERTKILKKWYLGNNGFGFLAFVVTIFGYAKVFESLILKLVSIGDVTFRVRMLSSFQSSLQDLFMGLNDLFESSLLFKDAYLLFNTKPAFADGVVKLIKLPAGPRIEFKNVSFQYPRSDKFVFKNLNLTINSGEKVALVGPNGVGKTTLVKLICRMYPVTEGEILINGTNVNELSAESWYQNLGVLFQDFNMYDQLTAKENILIGDTSTRPNFEKVKKAAESADAKGFIEAFSNGWDQLLNPAYKGGIRPSTGQWQKLAIARFFYRNAPLCIFDEPTASIDAVSEFKIFNRIYSFFKGKTVIIVSHRFSTVRNADRIIVLKKGQIVEEGSHADLMSNSGHYKEAFDLQASGYNQ